MQTQTPTPKGADVVMLSDLLGDAVVNDQGQRLGRLHDVVVRITGADPAPVVGVLIRHGPQDLFVPADAVIGFAAGTAIQTTDRAPTPFQRRANEALLARDVMDSQVIDLSGPRVVRVNDVRLSRFDTTWHADGIDVAVNALVRRLLPRALRQRHAGGRLLHWQDIELFASEVPGGGLPADHKRLARRHPADIARVTDAVPARQATEIVSSLDDNLAADTMEEMIDEKQADVIEELDPERAADILERMAPDAAADVLAELQPEVVDTVLQRMVPTEAADVHALLTYPPDTAGGLMTTDYVMAPRELRVSEATAFLRPQMEIPDWVYYVYVVENMRERRLKGVISLRDLFLADPTQTMGDIMTGVLRQVRPETSAATVAQIMSDYNLMALPVSDAEGRLLGIVSVDDALEVILPDELRRRIPRVFS